MSQLMPVEALRRKQLDDLINPGDADMQAFRAPLYDTQLYTSASTTSLTFFGAINTDKSMSNVKGQGGVFPNNFYFEPIWMNIDILANASLGANTALGIQDDIQRLVLSGRGFFQITIGQLTYPQTPISYAHASGGAVGSLAGTWTAPQQVQVGNNGVQDSGYSVYRSFIIGPQMPFSVVLTWPSAQTLASGNTNIRVSFDGNWHTPVQ